MSRAGGRADNRAGALVLALTLALALAELRPLALALVLALAPAEPRPPPAGETGGWWERQGRRTRANVRDGQESSWWPMAAAKDVP